MTLLCGIILFMPYIHVKYNGSDVEGVFGFRWMSSFLFALALPSVLMASGLLLRFLSNKVDKELQTFLIVFSKLVLLSGSFFLVWTFYPMTDDFKPTTYYPLLILFAIGLTVICTLLHKAFLITEARLKKIIERLFKALYEDLEERNLIDPYKKKAFKKYRIELTEIIVDYEQL